MTENGAASFYERVGSSRPGSVARNSGAAGEVKGTVLRQSALSRAKSRAVSSAGLDLNTRRPSPSAAWNSPSDPNNDDASIRARC
jgi:hypothetical protein